MADPSPPPDPSRSTVYDAHTLRLVDASPDEIAAAPERFQPAGEQKTVMLGPDGQHYDVPASSAQQALDMGWSFPAREAGLVAGEVERQKAARVGGAFSVGARAFTDSLLMGAPGAVDAHQAAADPLYAQALQQAQDEHRTAHMVGAGAGLVANALLTGGAAGAVGDAAESAALGARAAEGASAARAVTDAVAPGLARRALGYAARGAAEGALYASPQAVAQAAYGDPESAAEGLVWGIGTGGLLGLGAGSFREALGAGLGKVQGLARDAGVAHGLVDEAGAVNPSRLAELAERAQPARSAEELDAARSELESKLAGHAPELDAALAKVPDDTAAAARVKPTELAAEIQDQVIGANPGLETPLFASEKTQLSKVIETVSSYGDKPVSLEKLQEIKALVADKTSQITGKPQKILSQALGVIQATQDQAMTEGYKAAGLTDGFANYLADKAKLAGLDTARQGLIAPLVQRGASAVTGAIGGAVGGVLGGLVGGPIGSFVGSSAAKPLVDLALRHTIESKGLELGTSALRKIARSPEAAQWIGAAMAKGAADGVAKHLTAIPLTLATKAAASSVPDPIKGFLGSSANGLSKAQQYDRATAALASAKAAPDSVQAEAAALGHLFGHDAQLQSLVAQKQLAHIDYLASSIPKDPNPPKPFQPSTWAPSTADKKAFADKLEIAQNPMAALEHVRDGSLSPAHVEALSVLYPALQSRIVGEVAKMAYDPKSPALDRGVKQGLSLLTGAPLANPGGVNYQAAYQAAQQQQQPSAAAPKASRHPKTGGGQSLMTGVQRLAGK